jgi:uncharacterized membrane protein YfcA
MEYSLSDRPLEALGLAIATLAAGAINALAGGGTLLTFPALLALTDAVTANCTSTLALLPGSLAGAWAYRRELKENVAWLRWLVPVSIVGAILGGLLLVFPDPGYFNRIVPYLALTATVLFALQPFLVPRIKLEGLNPRNPPLWLLAFQFAIAVYGAYFGAGIGIMMLALLGLLPLGGLVHANGLKTLLAGLINIVAAVVFLGYGSIRWDVLVLMAPLSVIGGYLGGVFGRGLSKNWLRAIVLMVGFGQTIWFFARMSAGQPAVGPEANGPTSPPEKTSVTRSQWRTPLAEARFRESRQGA